MTRRQQSNPHLWRQFGQQRDVTCRALAAPEIDPLNLENTIRLHLLINVFLSCCAPVGVTPTAAHPISADDPKRSWIRLLGRLVSELDTPMARTSKRMAKDDLDEECIEALATILFCAELVLDAAQEAVMLPAVIVKLEAVKGRLARIGARILTGSPAAEALVGQQLASMAASHRLMPRSATPAVAAN